MSFDGAWTAHSDQMDAIVRDLIIACSHAMRSTLHGEQLDASAAGYRDAVERLASDRALEVASRMCTALTSELILDAQRGDRDPRLCACASCTVL